MIPRGYPINTHALLHFHITISTKQLKTSHKMNFKIIYFLLFAICSGFTVGQQRRQTDNGMKMLISSTTYDRLMQAIKVAMLKEKSRKIVYSLF